jgi:hypothetical protein
MKPPDPNPSAMDSDPPITSTLHDSAYPSSPPPTYASATQAYNPIHDSRPNYEGSETLPRKSNVEVRGMTVLSTQALASDKKPMEVYAYQNPDYGRYPSTLRKEDSYMSGTNHAGPVDPFSYAELDGQPISTRPQSNNIHEVSELFGDLSFPVELPDNSPGPPPGYPRPIARSLPKRRPISSPLSSVTSNTGRSRTSLSYELSGTSSQTELTPSSRTSEFPRYTLKASSLPASVPPPNHNTGPLETMKAPSSQPMRSNTGVSVRMRSQQGYMDLLRSIEPN